MKLPFTSGRHRRTPEAWTSMAAELEQALADRDRWQKIAEQRGTALDDANRLMTRVCAEKTAAEEKLGRSEAELEAYKVGNAHLVVENDELSARLIKARGELANLRAISVPAPADGKPTIPLRPYDPDATQDVNVSTLWDGIHTIKVADVRSLVVKAKAAA